jgi:uncharacterized protein (TIGR03083 family)
VSLLGVAELCRERQGFLATIESLSDADFESGRTLCAEWAPRDVLAHLIGTADLALYVRTGMRIGVANAVAVERGRELDRAQLSARGQTWARRPILAHRVGAWGFLGDVSVHHQDVLRGLGRTRELPAGIAAAIFREGVILSTGTRRNLLTHRVEPTTPGAPALGRGRVVRGSTEALGLWLAGRTGLDDELEFAAA